MAALTPLAGSSARSLVLDPMGRILQTTDENGVVTKWTYNPRGQVKTIERAVTKPEDRTTVFNYDCRGDLYRIAPPAGGAGRILFVYLRHAGAAVAGERHYGCGGLLPSGPASDGASASPRLASRNGSAVSRCEKKVMELCPLRRPSPA